MQQKQNPVPARQLRSQIDGLLCPDASFDVVRRPLVIGDRQSVLYFVDGFAKDEVMEKVLEFIMKITPEQLEGIDTVDGFCARFVPYIEMNTETDPQKAATSVLSGALVLLVDGYDSYIVIDARTYPVRSMNEPENERVLRGARDGFVETLVFNTASIRRRIRDPHLVMELHAVGEKSKTDVVIAYLSNKADKKFVKAIAKKLDDIKVEALPMGQQSLAECLVRYRWYNPFPKLRYTERPDSAAANVLEGKVIVLVDNSPSAIILPTSFFDFLQETDDYYFPPLTGSYLRLLRTAIFVTTLFLTPLWYLFLRNPSWLPPWLAFIEIKEPASLPVIVQLLILELAVDGIKLASLNTPGALGNSLSIIGGLILGEYAVQAGWFSGEVILYMAFVALANFTQPSYELGYAFKFMRVILLIFTALFNWIGFLAGFILILVLIGSNRTIEGRSYLYPLIPFNGKKLKSLFFRLSIHDPAIRSNRIEKR